MKRFNVIISLLAVTILFVQPNTNPCYSSVFFDKQGNVISEKGGGAGIFKLASTDGSLLWESSPPANIMAGKIDQIGNMFFLTLNQNNTYSITKYSSTDGTALWKTDTNQYVWIVHTEFGDYPYLEVSLDNNGDLIVSGAEQEDLCFIAKYRGTDGSFVWKAIHNAIPYGGAFSNSNFEITIDRKGDIIATGTNDGNTGFFAKYRGTIGSLIWEISGNPARIYVDKKGDIIASEVLNFIPFIGKYRGKDGVRVWEINPSSDPDFEFPLPIDFDVKGDVIAHTNRNEGQDFISKYNSKDGSLVWEVNSSGWGLSLDKKGDMIGREGSNSIAKYRNKDGALLWETSFTVWVDSWIYFSIDKKGDVIVTGAKARNVCFIAKHKGKDGTLVWEASHDAQEDNFIGFPIIDIDLDSKGDIIASGTNGNGLDFIAKYKGKNGALIWEKIISPQNCMNIYTLTVDVNPSDGGEVVKSPTKMAYCPGEQVTLTANANIGYAFSGWLGDFSGIDNPISITMDGSKNITANFTPTSNLAPNPSFEEGIGANPDAWKVGAPSEGGSYVWENSKSHTGLHSLSISNIDITKPDTLFYWETQDYILIEPNESYELSVWFYWSTTPDNLERAGIAVYFYDANGHWTSGTRADLVPEYVVGKWYQGRLTFGTYAVSGRIKIRLGRIYGQSTNQQAILYFDDVRLVK